MKLTKRAFTLVEILTVAAMICLIMAVIVVAYNGVYRSWATSNTIATMKSAQLALERYKLENGLFPTGSNTLGEIAKNHETLKKDLLQNCAPFSYMDGSDLKIFDDFGDKPPQTTQEIYYISLASSENRDIFMLASEGKDGEWGGEDDIVFLPFGMPSKSLKAGFYMCSTNASGEISGEIEPLAQ